jgi:hypothetical protein
LVSNFTTCSFELHFKKMRMKYFYATFILFVSNLIAYGQAQIVINNDAYIVLDGGSVLEPIYVVLDNPNDDGLSTTGSGGNWVSEDEYNKLRWRIGSNTGNYQIPFTSSSANNIPFEMQITSAGVGGDFIDFSTYGTPSNNLPWPSTVTHFEAADGSLIDNSPNVINRFWVNDAGDYATRPNVTLTFTYDDPNDFSGLNAGIVPGAMVAQRFRTSDNTWGGSYSGSSLFFGTDNGSAVVNAVVSSADFWEAWTLSTTQLLLPVELTSFSAKCMETYVQLNWTTASELNNDYFLIERSLNGQDWTAIAEVDGQGTKNDETHYEIKDENPRAVTSYYRLRQVDFDGSEEVFPIKSLKPCGENSGIEIISQNNGSYQVIFSDDATGNYQIDLYDMSGKMIRDSRSINIEGGENMFLFDDSHAAAGVYTVVVSSSQEQITKRIVIY